MKTNKTTCCFFGHRKITELEIIKIRGAGRGVYVERNFEMIDKSHFCIVYYDKGYMLQKQKRLKSDVFYHNPKSGTAVAYDYAVKNGRIKDGIIKNNEKTVEFFAWVWFNKVKICK